MHFASKFAQILQASAITNPDQEAALTAPLRHIRATRNDFESMKGAFTDALHNALRAHGFRKWFVVEDFDLGRFVFSFDVKYVAIFGKNNINAFYLQNRETGLVEVCDYTNVTFLKTYLDCLKEVHHVGFGGRSYGSAFGGAPWMQDQQIGVMYQQHPGRRFCQTTPHPAVCHDNGMLLDAWIVEAFVDYFSNRES